MMNLKNLARRFRKDERGVTLVEYGVAVAVAVLVGVTGLSGLAGNINTSMQDSGNYMCTGGTCGPAAGGTGGTTN